MTFDLTARHNTDPMEMRRFVLVRDEDETGISGTGLVAFGVMFPDRVAVTRWNSDVAQTCVWQTMEEVEAVHGHGGRTRIVWIDNEGMHITPEAFYGLLRLFMASDPSPLPGKYEDAVRRFMDTESKRRGYDGWVEAFHRFDA